MFACPRESRLVLLGKSCVVEVSTDILPSFLSQLYSFLSGHGQQSPDATRDIFWNHMGYRKTTPSVRHNVVEDVIMPSKENARARHHVVVELVGRDAIAEQEACAKTDIGNVG